MQQLQEASTDIIVIINKQNFKENILIKLQKHLNRDYHLILLAEAKPQSLQERMHGSEGNVSGTLQNSGVSSVIKPGKKHDTQFYTFRSDTFSFPALCLLRCLSIVGPVSQPQFYISELDKLITQAINTKEEQRMQRVGEFVPESLISQLEQGGAIRKYPNPLAYQTDLNTQSIDASLQLIVVPKLICDAIDNETDAADKAISIMYVQHALDNILTGRNALSMIHLHYIMVLCDELFDVCVAKHASLGDAYVNESDRLKWRISQYCKNY